MKLLDKWAKMDGGREFRLTLLGLSLTITLIAIYAPHFTGECAILGFFTNAIWIYGSK